MCVHLQERAEAAAAEFRQNGLSDVVSVGHRDIEGLGFPEEHHGTAQVPIQLLPPTPGADKSWADQDDDVAWHLTFMDCCPTVQGVFLDLPAPWKAAVSAVHCLAPNGVFISFSPCIEQVHHLIWMEKVLQPCDPQPRRAHRVAGLQIDIVCFTEKIAAKEVTAKFPRTFDQTWLQ